MTAKAKEKTFLIAHTDKRGHNCAQASITSSKEKDALKLFAEQYPQRDIVTVAVKH